MLATDEEQDDMRVVGLTILGKPPKPGTSLKEQNRLFRGHYGTGWAAAATVWKALLKVDAEVNGQSRGGNLQMKEKHLFWCLYFFKVYASEDVSSTAMGCTPKPFR